MLQLNLKTFQEGATVHQVGEGHPEQHCALLHPWPRLRRWILPLQVWKQGSRNCFHNCQRPRGNLYPPYFGQQEERYSLTCISNFNQIVR